MLNPQCVWLSIIFFSCLDTNFARWNVHFAWLDCHFTSQPTAFSEASQLRSSWRAACNCWVQHLVRPKGIFDGIHWRLIIFPRKKCVIYHFMGYTELKKTRLLMMVSLYWGSKKEIGDESVFVAENRTAVFSVFSFRQWVFFWHQEVELPAGGELPLWLWRSGADWSDRNIPCPNVVVTFVCWIAATE